MHNSFVDNGYQIIKSAIPKEVAKFCFDYFLLKRDAFDFMTKENILPPGPFSYFGRRGDRLVNDCYCHYADHAMETLLLQLKPVMERSTGLKLVPTYSYARAYENGAILNKHKDRASCEISTTLNLGGDSWPIYLEPKKEIGFYNDDDEYVHGETEGIRVDLSPGDMLIYKGIDLEHWREEFSGNTCVQVFLHYNTYNAENLKNIFDGRPLPGLPHATYEKK